MLMKFIKIRQSPGEQKGWEAFIMAVLLTLVNIFVLFKLNSNK